MAKTKQEYFDDMMEGRLSYPTLTSILTSLSNASFYQSLFMLFSEFASDFELMFDAFLEKIENIFASKQVMQTSWWQTQCVGFQYGYSLARDESGNLYYSDLDEDAQIVKRAAVITTGNGVITIKIAKLDADGLTPIPLLVGEKSAFDSYANDITVAGIVPTVISVSGDEIKIKINVQVDAQVIDPNTGALLSDESIKPIESVVYDYFSSFQTQDSFTAGGVFQVNQLLAGLNTASGVFNATITLCEKKSQNESTYTNVLSLPGKQFSSFAGYVRIADGYDLAANISYE